MRLPLAVIAGLALAGCESEPPPHPGRPAVSMADVEVPPPAPAPFELADLVKEFDTAVAENRHADAVNAGVRLRSYYPDAPETRARDAQTTVSASARSGGASGGGTGGGAPGRTYTPAQLRQMAATGRWPDQTPPTTQRRAMGFEECKLAGGSIMAELAGLYPVEVVVNTGILRIDKAWTNDGTVMVTCSQPDRTMVITSAKYR